MSTERVIVVDAVADAFARKVAAKAASIAAGDPREGKAPLGALVAQKSVHNVNRLIDDAVAKGAKVIAGGKAESVIMPATVVDGVTAAMDLYRDESFAPVVALIRARDAEHAIELANDSEYGLAASVFTRDIALGLTIARRIRSGICHINGPTVHDEPQMPFGGVGASGHGRFGGRQGIDSFTETRWITIATQPGHFPI
jgi:acyl-CoA reductase-like NAD-dependent aldehyde dehydrogenase